MCSFVIIRAVDVFAFDASKRVQPLFTRTLSVYYQTPIQRRASKKVLGMVRASNWPSEDIKLQNRLLSTEEPNGASKEALSILAAASVHLERLERLIVPPVPSPVSRWMGSYPTGLVGIGACTLRLWMTGFFSLLLSRLYGKKGFNSLVAIT